MTTLPPPFDWSRRLKGEWTSAQGLERITQAVASHISYEPRSFQLYDSACILEGTDVFCITKTGDGKSALILFPALVRKEMINIVIEPTNCLESEMSSNLRSKGVSAVVINGDTLSEAARSGRDLWAEATAGHYQVITLAPETLQLDQFKHMIRQAQFREWWGVLTIDEAHLTHEWGVDFRVHYGDIWSIRAYAPPHVVFVGLSATIEPGLQTKEVLRRIGFRQGAYHFDKRDCERHNIDFIFRNIQFTSTGHVFRDLDWMVPPDLISAFAIVKRLLFVVSIEMGHRITLYLRSLLPPHLQPLGHLIIRHMHSMNCPECKHDGLTALHQTGADRQTAIFVTSPLLEVGINVPDIEDVVIFPEPSSAASCIQRAGRAARGPEVPHGRAIVYVKQSTRDSALEYVKSEPPDMRILSAPTHQESTTGQTEMDVDEGQFNDYDDAMDVDPCTPCAVAEPNTQSVQKSRADSGPVKPGRRVCFCLLLAIAAHVRGVCIQRQFNIIYDNPNQDQDCGRCSSCVPNSSPEPRPLSPAQPAETIPDTTKRYLRPPQRDLKSIGRLLARAALRIWQTQPCHPDALLLSSKCFLTEMDIKCITHSFHLVTSKEILAARLQTREWRYWNQYGDILWFTVNAVREDLQKELNNRQLEINAKQRETRRHQKELKANAALETVGSGQASRMASGLTLIIPARLSASVDPRDDVALPVPPVSSGSRVLLLLADANSEPVANTHAASLSSRKRAASNTPTSPRKAPRQALTTAKENSTTKQPAPNTRSRRTHQ